MVYNDEILLAFVLFPMVYALLLYQIPNKEGLWQVAVTGGGVMCGLSLWLLFQGGEAEIILPLFTDSGIGLESSPFALLYGVITTFLWLVSLIATKEYMDRMPEDGSLNIYYASLFMVLSGSLGVFFAYDLLTLFVFFEIMSFGSYLWVVQAKNKKAFESANLYLTYGVIGGLAMLLGIFFLIPITLDLRISQLSQIFSDIAKSQGAVFACQFLFLGFGAKAGAFFLHEYIPPAYVEAPAPATALLSSILSKCGLYGVLIVMVKIIPDIAGFSYFILCIAILNMFVGGLCAFLSGNLKRTFAFSSVSQIGFILWGISMQNLLIEHNTFAAYGTIFHMINHSFIKILMFCLTGIVFQNTHTLELSELKGYGKGKKWFQILFIIGGLSLAAVPLFPGYVSKTLLHEAMVEYMHYYSHSMIYTIYEWLFLISGGFTVAYILKLYVCLFVEEGKSQTMTENNYASKLLLLTLSLVAVVLVGMGITPNLSFAWVGEFTAEFFPVHTVDSINYFSLTNLKGSAISILIGILFYIFDKKFELAHNLSLYEEKMKWNDSVLEHMYRPGIWFMSLFFGTIARVFDIMCETFVFISSRGFFQDEEIPDTFFHGADNQQKHKPIKLHITHSLAFSLLMFGFGFIFTIVYLLVVGGTLQLDLIIGT